MSAAGDIKSELGGRLAREAAALAVSSKCSAEALLDALAWLNAAGYDLSRRQYFQPVTTPPETLPDGITVLRLPEHRLPLDREATHEAQLNPEVAAAMERMNRAAALDEAYAGGIAELFVDVETYSEADIAACGAYKYAADATTRLLLVAWSVNGGPVEQADTAHGEALPDAIREALTDPGVVKKAWNAAFERAVMRHMLGVDSPATQWEDTMHLASRCGRPLSLDQCGKVLGIERPKMTEGRRLIRLFSTPSNLKEREGDWEAFKAYNRRDVEAEIDIDRKLDGTVRVPAWERETELTDWAINGRGVLIDTEMATRAAAMYEKERAALKDELTRLTGLDNPNSASQLKGWLSEQTGREVASIDKKAMGAVTDGASADVARAAALRAELGKQSCTKFAAAVAAAGKDGRVRGLTQYYGAVRTGRWAGRLVQVQNLPQNKISDLDYARELVKAGDVEALRFDYGVVTPVLSELVRTMFVAPEGQTLGVCDYSAIEARVVAWMAGERWALDVFRGDGKIYEATAARMYHVPVREISKHDPRRQKGKIAVLSLGYGGGVNALEAMGGAKMGLTESEMSQVVKDWRRANPAIVTLWGMLEAAARRALFMGRAETVRGIVMEMRRGDLVVTLPSGRELCYANFGVDGKTARMIYDGQNQVTRQWGNLETYGGKMTENLVQATARDLLAVTLVRLERAGYRTVFHVHDEAVCELDAGHTLDGMRKIFETPPKWARDLPLRAAGYETPFYKKD